VREDLRPNLPTQHEEHQDVEQPQEIDVNRTNTFVFAARLKDACDADRHRKVPPIKQPNIMMNFSGRRH
jgi:hypothetical protein